MNAAVSGKLLPYGEAFSVSQFTWFDRAGQPLGVMGEPGEYIYFRLSPDGRLVVASRAKPGGRDLWLLADRGVASRFTLTPGLKMYLGSRCIPPDNHTSVIMSPMVRSKRNHGSDA